MFVKDSIFGIVFVLILNCSTKISTYTEKILTKNDPDPPLKKKRRSSFKLVIYQ